MKQIETGWIKSDSTKHLHTRLYYAKDLVELGEITVSQISSADNVADIFTKTLARPRHIELRRKLGMMLMPEDAVKR
ncbi:hypothetical protein SeLEV6574_g08637 [Synchytrium endobioticum]|uniref:Uncharacterized protein n=1 Tax=Synchytrium endobioticum TaxID=286115 RepID=A0A507BRL5_9FUNG|nr:hypothetical protein SeLEV6574_g08637 [Synchytrium endobioticum]